MIRGPLSPIDSTSDGAFARRRRPGRQRIARSTCASSSRLRAGVLARVGVDRRPLELAAPGEALADLQARGAGLAVDEDLQGLRGRFGLSADHHIEHDEAPCASNVSTEAFAGTLREDG